MIISVLSVKRAPESQWHSQCWQSNDSIVVNPLSDDVTMSYTGSNFLSSFVMLRAVTIGTAMAACAVAGVAMLL